MEDVWNRVIIEFTQAQPSDLTEGGFCQARIWINGDIVLNSTFGNFSNGKLFYDAENYSLDLCSRIPLADNNRDSYLDYANFVWIKGSGMAYMNNSGIYQYLLSLNSATSLNL